MALGTAAQSVEGVRHLALSISLNMPTQLVASVAAAVAPSSTPTQKLSARLLTCARTAWRLRRATTTAIYATFARTGASCAAATGATRRFARIVGTYEGTTKSGIAGIVRKTKESRIYLGKNLNIKHFIACHGAL